MRRNDAMPAAAIRGMTLIETTLALLIAALVGAYAVPAYREYLARGHRQAAVNALYACALQLEAGDDAGGAQGRPAHGAGGAPQSPRTCASTTSAYGIDVRGAGSGMGSRTESRTESAARGDAPQGKLAYVIEATPRPRGPQHADRCGVFTLDALGRHGNRRPDARGERDFEGCWRGMRR